MQRIKDIQVPAFTDSLTIVGGNLKYEMQLITHVFLYQ